MNTALTLVTATMLFAVMNPGHIQAEGLTAQTPEAAAEVLIRAQLQIDGNAQGASAAEIAARVVDALADQGYRVVEVSRTYLGRLRVVAESDVDRREVIVSRTTGAILRDRITATFEVANSGDASIDSTGTTTLRDDIGVTGGLAGGVDLGLSGGLDSNGSNTGGARGSLGGSVSVGVGN